jgi:protein-S-isoprenylcysteine O-methyltransferase Ste14
MLGVATGLGIVLAASVAFRSWGRVLGGRVDGLVEPGVYRWSRNPQLVGCGVFLLAFVVLWPSWYTAPAALVYVGVAHRMTRVEEEHLLRSYGEEYEQYRRKTPRYIGLPKSGESG